MHCNMTWIPPRPPADEAARLAELRGYGILDTGAEERFDRITRLAISACRADEAFLSFMDSDHQWMKSRTTSALAETCARDSSICTLVVASGDDVVIDDVKTDPALAGHAMAMSIPWHFYAGVPLRGEHGHVIGTLCVLGRAAGAPNGFDTRALHDLAAITSDELRLSRQNRELVRISNTDSLSGIANRRMFDFELARAWRRARRTAQAASLLLVDLDHFKTINDTLGHAAGDTAITTFANLLDGFARRPDDLAARIGGEEFGLILAGADVTGAQTVAQRVLDALGEVRIPHPVSGLLTASIGIATLADAEAPETWYRRTDGALYAAKAAGRATIRIA